VVDPVKIFLPSSSITMQNFVTVFHTVNTHAGGPKSLGTMGPRPSDWGRGDPEKHVPPRHVLLYRIWSLSVNPYRRK